MKNENLVVELIKEQLGDVTIKIDSYGEIRINYWECMHSTKLYNINEQLKSKGISLVECDDDRKYFYSIVENK